MKISERILESTAQVRDQAAAYVNQTMQGARDGVQRAAVRLESAGTPVDVLTNAARRMNDLSHSYFERLLEQNTATMKAALNGSAQRLRQLAAARDVSGAYRDQVDALRGTRERVARDAKATWEIVTDTGREMSELAIETYAQLRGAPRRKAAGASRRTRARRTVKKAKRATRAAA
jgi:phasin family protein